MIRPGIFSEKITIFRGTDCKVYLEFIDPKTKNPIDYSDATFSAILIDQQDSDYIVLATFSTTANTSLTACTSTVEFKLDHSTTASLGQNYAYFRMYCEEFDERYLYAMGNVDIRD